MTSTSRRGRPPASRDDFQIAIICALSEERDTVEALMTRDYKSEKSDYGQASADDNYYTLGELGGKPIVLVTPRNMGTINTSHLAINMRHSFPNLAWALVVGIAGGAPFDRNMQPSEIHLGDVLISTQVIGYDFGAVYDDKFKSKTAIEDVFPRAPARVTNFLNIFKTRRGNAFKRLLAKTQQELGDLPQFAGEEYQRPASDTDRVYESHYRHKHQDPTVCETCSKCQERHHPVCHEAIKASCKELGCQPQFTREARDPMIHFGRVASGNGVMKSARRRDTLIQNEDCIGFEMEGAGTWELFGTIVVKGVVDYADSHKNKRWRLYPALRAALCAKALVEEIELSPVTATQALEAIQRQRNSPAHHLSLLQAATAGDLYTLKRLLQLGANTSIRDEKGSTCLVKAINARRKSIVEELIQSGTDVNFVNTDDWSPLHEATCEGLADIASMLIRAGANVHLKDKDGWPTLHWAAYKGFKAIVDELILADADLDCVSSKDGWTALHFATRWRHHDVMLALIMAGAAINKPSLLRLTPLDIAEDPDTLHGYPDKTIIELLRKHGATNRQLAHRRDDNDNT